MATSVCADGTQFEVNGDGRLHLKTGCGLETAGGGVRVNASEAAWPFACGRENGGAVYCDPASGQLHVDPGHTSIAGRVGGGEAFSGAVGGDGRTNLAIVSFVVANPSPCRSMQVFFGFDYAATYHATGFGPPTFHVGWAASNSVNGISSAYLSSEEPAIFDGTAFIRTHSQSGVLTLAPGQAVTVDSGQSMVSPGQGMFLDRWDCAVAYHGTTV